MAMAAAAEEGPRAEEQEVPPSVDEPLAVEQKSLAGATGTCKEQVQEGLDKECKSQEEVGLETVETVESFPEVTPSRSCHSAAELAEAAEPPPDTSGQLPESLPESGSKEPEGGRHEAQAVETLESFSEVSPTSSQLVPATLPQSAEVPADNAQQQVQEPPPSKNSDEEALHAQGEPAEISEPLATAEPQECVEQTGVSSEVSPDKQEENAERPDQDVADEADKRLEVACDTGRPSDESAAQYQSSGQDSVDTNEDSVESKEDSGGETAREGKRDPRVIPEEGFGALNSRRMSEDNTKKGHLVLTRRPSICSSSGSLSNDEAQDFEDVLHKRAELGLLGSEEAWFRWTPPNATSRDYRLNLRCLHRDYFDVHLSETYFTRMAIVAEVQFIESMNANFIVHITNDEDGTCMPRGEVGELQWRGQLIGYATLLKEPMGSVWPATHTSLSEKPKGIRVIQLILVKRTVLLSRLGQEGNQHAIVRVPQRNHPPEDVRLRLHFCATDTIMYAPDTRLRLLWGFSMLNGQGDEPAYDSSWGEGLRELVECGREATVVRLNKAGLYEVRFDGDQADRLFTFDPQPHNHRMATDYCFEVDTKLVVLRPQSVRCPSKNSRSGRSSSKNGSTSSSFSLNGLSKSLASSVSQMLKSGENGRVRSSQVQYQWSEVRVSRCLEQKRFEVVDETSDEVTCWTLEPSVLCCAWLRIGLAEFAAARQVYSKSLHARCCFAPDLLVANRLYGMKEELIQLGLAFPIAEPTSSSTARSVTSQALSHIASVIRRANPVADNGSEEDVQPWLRLLGVAEPPKKRLHGIHEVPCWLIVGPASSGRTILAQQLALEVLKMNTEIIPVLIDVADFVNVMRQVLNKNKRRGHKEAAKDPYCHRRFDFLEEYLQATYANMGLQESTDTLKMLQQARDIRRLVLIFDSLEHAGSMMPVMERFLAQLAYDGHRVVVMSLTSKEMGHLSMLEELFGVLQVQPLSQEQQSALAEGKLDSPNAGTLLAAVQASALAKVASSPIVFQMLLHVTACLGEDAIVQLVEKSTQVTYLDLDDLQMVLLVYDVAVPLAFQSKDSDANTSEVLAAVALGLQLMGRKSFQASDVPSLLQEVARGSLLPCWLALQKDFEASQCPLLRVHKAPDGTVLFSFGNESIKQYMAARLAAESIDVDLDAQMETAIFDADWHRFLLFYLPLRFRLGHPQHLHLQAMSIKGQKVGALLGLLQCAKTFRTANFANAHMHSEDVASIVDELRGSPTLISLTLAGNHLVGAGMNALAALLLEDPPLQDLDLQRCDLLPTCAQRLSDALKQNTRLLRINLGENFFGEGGAWHFGRVLQANTSLQEVDLNGNDVEMASGRIFGKALETNSHLQRLNLQYNYLEPEGTRRLLDGLLKNKTLQELDLQGNGMSVDEHGLLGQVLKHHQSLTVLNVSGCSLGDKGIEEMAKAIAQDTCRLHALQARANFVTAVGAKSFMQALSSKCSLKELDLSMNQIPEHLQKELQQAWGPRNGLLVSNQFEYHSESDEDALVLDKEPGLASIDSSSSEGEKNQDVLE